MATETSSIDDVLATSHLPPESPAIQPESEPEDLENSPEAEQQDAPSEQAENEDGVDDYGNETVKSESKTYTEEEVNERINKAVRERLARLKESSPAPNQQPTMQQQQQAADAGFQYDENSAQDWQQQLKQFIRQTNEEVMREQYQRQQSEREQAAQIQFEEKFHSGMSKFQDFREVVGSQPITDAMTVATRSMKDPAAFLYAASKRHGDELKRIAGLSDPYSQMVEMGRLEERMKKTRAMTQAPRPIGNTREDSTVREPDKREPTIEDLMAQADERKLRKMKARRG
jgi:hypothetical protein